MHRVDKKCALKMIKRLSSEILRQKSSECYRVRKTLRYQSGTLYLGPAPGKRTSAKKASLCRDIEIMKKLRIDTVVCLLQPEEMVKLGIRDYSRSIRSSFSELYHVPIKDMTAPDQKTLAMLADIVSKFLMMGKNVFVHCRCGKGRSGCVAASAMVALGKAPKEAIEMIGVCNLTEEQRRSVYTFKSSLELSAP